MGSLVSYDPYCGIAFTNQGKFQKCNLYDDEKEEHQEEKN